MHCGQNISARFGQFPQRKGLVASSAESTKIFMICVNFVRQNGHCEFFKELRHCWQAQCPQGTQVEIKWLDLSKGK